MRSVTLAGTGIQSSALGFGCSQLMGDKTEAESRRLLETAFDGGIRYFDVARMYGFGEAERVVGRFAKGKRDQIVIATKFGIEPMAQAASLSALRSIARRLMRLSPRFRSAIGAGARAMMSKPRFTPEAAQSSLETSLRMLGTEYIDVFLLHECSSQDADSPELLEFLRDAVKQGKIRAFGIGSSVDAAQAICHLHPELAQVAQFQNSILVSGLEMVKPPAAAITHGAVAAGFSEITTYLRSQPNVARQWADQLGAALDSGALAGLMLSYGLLSNNAGPVLFSSRSIDRIRDNIRTADETPFGHAQINTFARLIRNWRDGQAAASRS